jgi:hypothetical protein
MEIRPLAEFLPALAMGIALASAAGLRAWLPMLAAGGLARLGVLELGPTFQFLASDKALAIFGIATVIEIVGDKIPAVDHALDVIGTPLTSTLLGVAVGAPTALVPHVAKSALRAVSSTTTAGFANPALSFIEDALTVMLLICAVLVPVLVVALVGFTLVVAARWLRRRRTLAPAA